MAALRAYVHVDGVVYAPGDDVPAHHAKLITNPKAWGDGEAPEGESLAPAPAPAGPVAPPRAGKGSGMDAWVTYAEALGLEVDESATRDDIIAAVDAL